MVLGGFEVFDAKNGHKGIGENASGVSEAEGAA